MISKTELKMTESFDSQEKKEIFSHINFDYESTRKAFFQELDYVLLKFKLNHKAYIKKSDIEKIISDPSRKYINTKGYKKLSSIKFKIAKENGKDILCNITRSNKAPYKILSFKQVLSIEEMFDVFTELHLCEPQLSVTEFYNKLSNCDILRCLIKLVWKACLCCRHIKLWYKTVAEMSVIKMYVPNDGVCRIFMYICKNTNFILLRPLKSTEPEEVANELLSIFCDFDFPDQWDCNSRNYFKEVFKCFESLPFQLFLPRMFTGSMEHKITIMEKKVKHMILNWMEKSKSRNWVIGAHIVQWTLNSNEVKDTYVRSKVIHGPIQSPYHALFGVLPNTDNVYFDFNKSMPENKNDFPVCSQCHQTVHKVYECHFCQSICHFMCCHRIVQDITETSILINKCNSCYNTSEEMILGS